MYLCCLLSLRDILSYCYGAIYSLFVLKVPLNPKQTNKTNNFCTRREFVLVPTVLQRKPAENSGPGFFLHTICPLCDAQLMIVQNRESWNFGCKINIYNVRLVHKARVSFVFLKCCYIVEVVRL